jgi:hypothetical protein
MISDVALRSQLLATFALLNRGRAKAFPAPTTLSKMLEKMAPSKSTGSSDRNIDAKGASCFATAAVEVWLRGVHSFLVSASLTEASPLWASVSGYYSSHYTVRGIAHLLGYFQLFNRRKIVRLKLEAGHYVCTFMSKGANDGEHKLYWRLVKDSTDFRGDELFTQREDPQYADALHRNHANYADHVDAIPRFKPLDEDALKQRIEYISKIVIDAPLLPRVGEFPDLERVQLIAYHRLVRFRRLLDELLGGKNRFWNVHRNPSFAAGYIDFQLAERGGLSQLYDA